MNEENGVSKGKVWTLHRERKLRGSTGNKKSVDSGEVRLTHAGDQRAGTSKKAALHLPGGGDEVKNRSRPAGTDLGIAVTESGKSKEQEMGSHWCTTQASEKKRKTHQRACRNSRGKISTKKVQKNRAGGGTKS